MKFSGTAGIFLVFTGGAVFETSAAWGVLLAAIGAIAGTLSKASA